MRTAVVLPAPFGPSTPRTVARSTVRSTPRRASVAPNRFTRPSACTAGMESDARVRRSGHELRPPRPKLCGGRDRPDDFTRTVRVDAAGHADGARVARLARHGIGSGWNARIDMQIVCILRHGVSSGSRRGIGVHGGRAAAPPRGPPRDRGRAGHRRLQRRRHGRRPVPVARRRLRGPRPTSRSSPADLAGLDVVFLCLPHGESQAIAAELVDTVGHVVDLGADFRLPVADYEQWYGEAHTAPELLDRFAFGMPELYRDEIVARPARRVARAATRRPRRWRWRRCSPPAWSSRPASWSTRCRASRARAGA